MLPFNPAAIVTALVVIGVCLAFIAAWLILLEIAAGRRADDDPYSNSDNWWT